MEMDSLFIFLISQYQTHPLGSNRCLSISFSVRLGKKLKNLNLARKGKMVILLEDDRLKPVIFLDLG